MTESDERTAHVPAPTTSYRGNCCRLGNPDEGLRKTGTGPTRGWLDVIFSSVRENGERRTGRSASDAKSRSCRLIIASRTARPFSQIPPTCSLLFASDRATRVLVRSVASNRNRTRNFLCHTLICVIYPSPRLIYWLRKNSVPLSFNNFFFFHEKSSYFNSLRCRNCVHLYLWKKLWTILFKSHF